MARNRGPLSRTLEDTPQERCSDLHGRRLRNGIRQHQQSPPNGTSRSFFRGCQRPWEKRNWIHELRTEPTPRIVLEVLVRPARRKRMLFPDRPITHEHIRQFCARFNEGIRVEYKSILSSTV